MARLTRSQLQPIGIDIGHDTVKMIQLEVTPEGLSVRAASRQALPAEARTRPDLRISLAVDLVRRMLREGGFRGRRAVVALPREIVHMKNFRMPLMPHAELEGAVLLESRQLFPFDTAEAVVRFVPAGEVRQGNDVLQEVIVAAARDEDVANFVEQMHRCGVSLASLDIEPCALFRGVERFIRRREDELEVQVLLDIGRASSQVVIGRGREISFMKSIDIGGRHIQDAIAAKLGISEDEVPPLRSRLTDTAEAADAGEAPGTATAGSIQAADGRDPVRQAVFDATRLVVEQLAREVSLCLRYQSVTFRGHRPTRLRLLGGESRDPHVHGMLSSILMIPVEIGRPLFSTDTARMVAMDRRGNMGEWAVALGLGLKCTEGRFAPRDGRPRGSALPAEGADDGEFGVGAEAAVGAEPAVASAGVSGPENGAASQEAPHA